VHGSFVVAVTLIYIGIGMYGQSSAQARDSARGYRALHRSGVAPRRQPRWQHVGDKRELPRGSVGVLAHVQAGCFQLRAQASTRHPRRGAEVSMGGAPLVIQTRRVRRNDDESLNARGRTRTGTGFPPRDFRTTTTFVAARRSRICGLDFTFAMPHVSQRFRQGPSSLYTFLFEAPRDDLGTPEQIRVPSNSLLEKTVAHSETERTPAQGLARYCSHPNVMLFHRL